MSDGRECILGCKGFGVCGCVCLGRFGIEEGKVVWVVLRRDEVKKGGCDGWGSEVGEEREKCRGCEGVRGEFGLCGNFGRWGC